MTEPSKLVERERGTCKFRQGGSGQKDPALEERGKGKKKRGNGGLENSTEREAALPEGKGRGMRLHLHPGGPRRGGERNKEDGTRTFPNLGGQRARLKDQQSPLTLSNAKDGRPKLLPFLLTGGEKASPSDPMEGEASCSKKRGDPNPKIAAPSQREKARNSASDPTRDGKKKKRARSASPTSTTFDKKKRKVRGFREHPEKRKKKGATLSPSSRKKIIPGESHDGPPSPLRGKPPS